MSHQIQGRATNISPLAGLWQCHLEAATGLAEHIVNLVFSGILQALPVLLYERKGSGI